MAHPCLSPNKDILFFAFYCGLDKGGYTYVAAVTVCNILVAVLRGSFLGTRTLGRSFFFKDYDVCIHAPAVAVIVLCMVLHLLLSS